jgi:Flp pilus assembly protein protease CpaA
MKALYSEAEVGGERDAEPTGGKNQTQLMPIAAKKNWKRLLPYAALPPLVIALLLVRIGRMDTFAALLYAVIAIFGYAAAVHDIKARRVPNGLILAMLGVWAVTVPILLFLDAEAAIARLVDSALGFAVGGGMFLLVYAVSRNGLGGGDVKFMAAAGLYLGYGGIVPAMLLGTIFAGLVGLALIMLKKIGRKDAIPLIPFLYIGILTIAFLS